MRAALQTSGLEFPHNKRITVNLAPADLPKESGRFDLPIALGILAAGGQIDAARLDGCEFAGELSLAGELRPVRGALAMALALRRAPAARRGAGAAAGERRRGGAGRRRSTVRGARHLLDVVRALLPGDARRRRRACARRGRCRRRAAPALPDLRDVQGPGRRPSARSRSPPPAATAC